MIQEGITNALKHAGARSLSVTVANEAGELVVTVRDDGCGFDVQSAKRSAQGKGLSSLEKRARALSAKLNLVSDAAGTELQVRIPLPKTAV
jgi:signal transduction histidine kinase